MSRTDYYNYYFSGDEVEGSSERIRAKNELVYNYIEPYLPPGGPVLELGVGKGYFAALCRERGHSYRGIEASEKQCQRLADEGYHVDCSKVPPLPPVNSGFGLIYSAHLLEHMPDSRTVHQLLLECTKLLQPHGIAAMLFPDATTMKQEFWNCDYTHAYPTTERRVAQAMADAGLEVVAAYHLNGHYTKVRRLLARAGSRPIFLRVALALSRISSLSARRQDLLYRSWMYLQQDILLIAKPQQASEGPRQAGKPPGRL